MRVKNNVLELSIVTSNLLRDQNPNRVKEDLDWVVNTWKPDIWGCQEGAGYTNLLKNVEGYGLALDRAGSAALRNNPILYNKDTLRLVDSKLFKMHDGKKGLFPDRYVNKAVFVDRVDGNTIKAYNTHVNSHIEKGGLPRDLPRVALSTKHLERMADMVREGSDGKALVFWLGDFNIDEHADDRKQHRSFMDFIFNKRGLVSVYDELNTPASFSTHGRRTIDVIGSHKADTRVKAVSVRRSDNRNSDHRFVQAIYTIKRGGSDPKDPSVPNPSPDPTRPDDQGTPTVPDPEAPKPPKVPHERDNGPSLSHDECCKGEAV